MAPTRINLNVGTRQQLIEELEQFLDGMGPFRGVDSPKAALYRDAIAALRMPCVREVQVRSAVYRVVELPVEREVPAPSARESSVAG
jgi:hypothetical protein